MLYIFDDTFYIFLMYPLIMVFSLILILLSFALYKWLIHTTFIIYLHIPVRYLLSYVFFLLISASSF